MADLTADAALAAKNAQDSELVALKQQVDRLKGDLTPGPTKQQKLRKACTGFEAVFIGKMWEQMRATIPKDGYLHSPQEDMYRSMFDRDFAEKMASDGGIGLGDMLYSQLKDKINGTSKTTATPGNAALKNGSATISAALTSGADTAALAALAGAAETTAPAGKAAPTSLTGKAAPTSLTGAAALKMPKRPFTGAGQRQTSAGTNAATGSAAPAQPASVQGDVMADVDSLARRIEEDYDHRQAVAGNPQVSNYGQTVRTYGSGTVAGRKVATTG